tara:strand:- start:7 stop:144 length:138 start_codon:yes stop_codon:yes gene_type:complete
VPAVSRGATVRFADAGGTINQRETIAMINAINKAVEDGAIVRVVQ